ncbi:MAG: cytochrome c3 family protein [Deltaproteobacteria bacterium]|nr:cytochrome c3 family protein [Deltaproteobacteria bacterium]
MDRRGVLSGVVCPVLFVLFLVTLVWELPAVGAAGKERGTADTLILDNKAYKSDRKGPVTFTHRKHAMDYRVSCWDCHHDYKDGKNLWSPWGETKQCAQCHDPKKSVDKVVNLQKAYHVNCKTCHQNLAAQKKKTGPHRKCLGCHKDEPAKK